MCLYLLITLCLAAAPASKPDPSSDARELFGPHHRVHSVWQSFLDSNGPKVEKPLEYTEVQTGLFYQENGSWLKSKEEIELREGHAIAYRGPHRIIFLANINRVGAIYLTDSKGRAFRSHILGLSYFDSANGKSVMISDLKDSTGQLLPPNQLIYKNAFADIKADVRFTYTKAGLEQDVILQELPPAPEEYGLNPETTRLEVLTEFIAPPEPIVTQTKLKMEKNAKRRSEMVEPDFVDENLDFGPLVIGLGKAFFTRAMEEEMPKPDPANGKGAKAGPPSGQRSIPVAKRWLKMEGRQVLVEAVEYKDIKAQLAAEPGQDLKQAKPAKREVSLWRALPELHPGSGDENMSVAQMPYRARGLVLDYYMVNTTPDFTFRSGQTYHINGEVYLSGTTRVEEDAVIKLASGATLRVLGTFQSPAKKACLTADHDHGLGVVVPTGQQRRLGTPALSFHNLENGAVIKNLEFRYAGVGLENYSPQAAHTVEDCNFFKCDTAVEAFGASMLLKNLQLTEVRTPHRTLGGGAEISSNNVIGTQSKTASQQLRLSTYDDYGNSIGSAAYLGPNGALSGSINYGGDEDYFRVDITSAGTLNAYSTGSTDTIGALVDASGNGLVYSDDNPYPNFNFSYTVNPGTYYLIVRHYSYYATGNYSVYTSFTSGGSSDDHGNSLSSATYINSNSSVGGTINFFGDEDYFQIYVSTPGTITAYTTGNSDTYGYLLDGSGNTLTSNDDSSYPNFYLSYAAGNGGSYYIRVRYDGYYGTGSYTLNVSFTPAPSIPQTPSGLSVIAVSQAAQANLQWNSSYGASGYQIKRSSSYSGPFSTVATTSGTYSTLFYDTTVAWGTTYYYVVSAINSAGESSDSYVVNVGIAPYPPSGLIASGGSAYISVSWNAASGAYGYYLKRSSSSGGPYSTSFYVGGNTSYVDSYNITSATTYYYVVSAISYSGAESYNSSQISATSLGAAPSMPTGLTASGGAQQISLSWNSASGATSYNVKRYNGSYYSSIASTSNTSYIDTGLSPNTIYYYAISASNSSGSSSDSSPVGTTTAPGVPSGLSASVGNTQITLSWSAVPGAFYYGLKRSTTSGGPYSIVAWPSSTSYTDGGLSTGVTYYYVVSAFNSAGAQGSNSAQISATPINSDSDGDGLPDSWEQQYFGNLSQNGSGDFDSDAFSNLQEYLAATNPTIVNATVRIARPRSGSNFP